MVSCFCEVKRAKDFGKEFDLVLDDGPVATASPEMQRKLARRLRRLCAYDAKASQELDKQMIHFWILNETYRQAISTFDVFLEVHANLPPAAFSEFDDLVCALLGTLVLKPALARRNVELALLALALGAAVSVAELAELQALGVNLAAEVETRVGKCPLLVVVAKKGNAEAVRFLLRNDFVEVGATDARGLTALHWAARRGHRDVVQTLLRTGASVAFPDRINGETALHSAAKGGHREVVDLLSQGTDVDITDLWGATPLHLAAKGGHTDVVVYLMSHRADACAASKKVCNLPKADREVPMPTHIAHFMVAVVRGRVPKHRARSPDIYSEVARDALGTTALHYAAACGHGNVAAELLRNKVDVGARMGNGMTALHYAAVSSHHEVLALLLSEGAEVGATDSVNGQTALHFAAGASGSHRKLVSLLLKGGAEVGAADYDGATALHIAAKGNRGEAVDALCSGGADVGAKDSDGRTALELARACGHAEVATLLLRR